jgi:hypothetical protein
MTTLIDPSYTYGGVPAKELRTILEMMSLYEPQAFNIKLADDSRVVGREPHPFYISFFIAHGLMNKLDGGGVTLTELGKDLLMANFRPPILRETAKVEIEKLKDRAKWILDDPDHMSYIHGIFIFGSYVDTEKQQLGDLDVGICIGLKPEIKKCKLEQQISLAKSSYHLNVPEASRVEPVDYMDWERENMLSHLVDGNEFISLHLSTEVPTLHVKNVLWVYSSHKPLSSHAILDKTQMLMVNSFLKKTA